MFHSVSVMKSLPSASIQPKCSPMSLSTLNSCADSRRSLFVSNFSRYVSKAGMDGSVDPRVDMKSVSPLATGVPIEPLDPSGKRLPRLSTVSSAHLSVACVRIKSARLLDAEALPDSFLPSAIDPLPGSREVTIPSVFTRIQEHPGKSAGRGYMAGSFGSARPRRRGPVSPRAPAGRTAIAAKIVPIRGCRAPARTGNSK